MRQFRGKRKCKVLKEMCYCRVNGPMWWVALKETFSNSVVLVTCLPGVSYVYGANKRVKIKRARWINTSTRRFKKALLTPPVNSGNYCVFPVRLTQNYSCWRNAAHSRWEESAYNSHRHVCCVETLKCQSTCDMTQWSSWQVSCIWIQGSSYASVHIDNELHFVIRQINN